MVFRGSGRPRPGSVRLATAEERKRLVDDRIAMAAAAGLVFGVAIICLAITLAAVGPWNV